ncbi:hypothetical protein JF55_09675 [Pseudomonas sp. 1-7]|nr:hypothetical protein JF55_09675 [Pseudomonas sp. 1-7]
MKLKRIGVDLAKQVFQVHGVDSHEQVKCRKQLKRHQMLDFFRQLEPCVVAMEACGSAHYWARELGKLGHEVRLIAPQFVKPYVKGGKNDANDAQLQGYDERLKKLEQLIQREAREDERVRRLMKIEGLGPISATAIVSAVGDARQFASGRQFAAWLGLVPSQYSTGGKERLGGISKRGDKYLRTLLIHGSRSVLKHCQSKTDKRSDWLSQLMCRRNKNIATVALANKNARIIWAILSKGEQYQPC